MPGCRHCTRVPSQQTVAPPHFTTKRQCRVWPCSKSSSGGVHCAECRQSNLAGPSALGSGHVLWHSRCRSGLGGPPFAGVHPVYMNGRGPGRASQQASMPSDGRGHAVLVVHCCLPLLGVVPLHLGRPMAETSGIASAVIATPGPYCPLPVPRPPAPRTVSVRGAHRRPPTDVGDGLLAYINQQHGPVLTGLLNTQGSCAQPGPPFGAPSRLHRQYQDGRCLGKGLVRPTHRRTKYNDWCEGRNPAGTGRSIHCAIIPVVRHRHTSTYCRCRSTASGSRAACDVLGRATCWRRVWKCVVFELSSSHRGRLPKAAPCSRLLSLRVSAADSAPGGALTLRINASAMPARSTRTQRASRSPRVPSRL